MIVMQTDTGTDLQNMLNSLGVYIMEWRMHLSDVWLQKNCITLIIAIIISVISITFGFQLSFFFSLAVYIMEWRMHLSDVWLHFFFITLIIAIIISVISITFGFQLSFFFLIYNFFKAMIFFPSHLLSCTFDFLPQLFLSCQHCLMHLIFTWFVCCDYCGNLSFYELFYNLDHYNVTSAFQYIAVSLSRPQYDMNKCIIMYVLQ